MREERVQRIRAAEFKAVCLRLMDRVRATGEEFIITKRNRAVAKLGPVKDGELRPFVGRSRGMISAAPEDLLAPVGEEWEVDADL
jgi:prevent-host-death family protein